MNSTVLAGPLLTGTVRNGHTYNHSLKFGYQSGLRKISQNVDEYPAESWPDKPARSAEHDKCYRRTAAQLRLMEQFLHQQLKIRRKSETNTGGCFYHKRWNKNQVDWHWAPRDWSVSGGHTEAASGGHSISAGANAPDCERSTCKQGLRWNRRSVTAPPY